MADEISPKLEALESVDGLLEVPPHQPDEAPESWVLADEIEYAGLECWSWRLEPFGRRAAVRAACVAAEGALPLFDEAARSPSRDLGTFLRNLEQGAPSPRAQIEAARRWAREPSEESLATAVAQFDHEATLAPEMLERPELEYLRGEPWPWSASSALCAVVCVEHPQLLRWLSRGLVSAARAIAARGAEPGPACLTVWERVRAELASGS